MIKLNSKEFIVKCGLVQIMQNLIDKDIVEGDDKYALTFCIDQHNYKLCNGQSNGFDQDAIIDTLDTLAEVFGLEVDYIK